MYSTLTKFTESVPLQLWIMKQVLGSKDVLIVENRNERLNNDIKRYQKRQPSIKSI